MLGRTVILIVEKQLILPCHDWPRIQWITFVSKYLIGIVLGPEDAGVLDCAGYKSFEHWRCRSSSGSSLWSIGQVGSMLAHLINLAVNRQKEFLADARARMM